MPLSDCTALLLIHYSLLLFLLSLYKMKKLVLFFAILFAASRAQAAYILIPMDDTQKNHLKAYGVAFYVLQQNVDVQWLLNYRGGSFMIADVSLFEKECNIRGVSYQLIADGQAQAILSEISNPEVNM